MPKIKINKDVRKLLEELDSDFTRYGQVNEKISNRQGDEIDNIAERNYIVHLIVGRAWLIVKAATGKKDVYETYGKV